MTSPAGEFSGVGNRLIAELAGVWATWTSLRFRPDTLLGPPGFGFRVVGTALAMFALPGMTFAGLAPLAFTEPGGVAWGTGAVLAGRTVYVYGVAADNQYVARVPFDRAVTGPWSFWTAGTWGASDPTVYGGRFAPMATPDARRRGSRSP